jgi:hypothetical protein
MVYSKGAILPQRRLDNVTGSTKGCYCFCSAVHPELYGICTGVGTRRVNILQNGERIGRSWVCDHCFRALVKLPEFEAVQR